MKNFSIQITTIGFFLSIFFLNSCKVAEEQSQNEQNNSVLSYFVSSQYAFNNTSMAQRMSSFYGGTLVSPKNYSLKKWAQPINGCLFSESDLGVPQAVRALNVGSALISDSANRKFSVNPQSDFSFYVLGEFVLQPGKATLATNANNNLFSTDQNFTVPEMGSDLRWVVEDSSQSYDLPSPAIPETTSDPLFFAKLKRGSDHKLYFRAPQDTDYVKAVISDGVSDSTKFAVVCYAEPKSGSIEIPAFAFEHFSESTDGRIQVDFVSVSYQTNGEKINETLVLSFKRHIHGLQGVPVNGNIQPVYFGALIIE